MAKTNTTANVNPETGEEMKPYETLKNGEIVSQFKYLEGHPRQIRFDAKAGSFNINGDAKTAFNTLTFQPIAWRIFTDNILNMGTKNWAELFFIDDKNCVSAVLFHGYSVDNIFRLIEPLYYDDLTLADVVITATPEKKENTKIQPKGVYYIATFSYAIATDAARTDALKAFAEDHRIFRQETLTDIANIKTAMNYYNPFAAGEEIELPAGVTRRELGQAVERHYGGHPDDAING